MGIYKVVYDDDLCYRHVSWFFDLDTAKKWCRLNKHNWMQWHVYDVYDKEGHEKYGGCNGQSYNGT